MRETLLRKILLLILILGVAGCAVSPLAPPYPPVPPVRAEAVPLPPVSEKPLIWQPGHWDWTGTTYQWREGRWVGREGHGTLWQDGYWAFQSGSWVWLPAHWT
jgi:hypothetical protein